jgi:hypothetical protein
LIKKGTTLENREMKRMLKSWIKIVLALLALVFFSLGCAGMEEEGRDKCPRCGTIFRIESMPPDAPRPRY